MGGRNGKTVDRSLGDILREKNRETLIQNADLLAFRGRGFIARLIATFGRGRVTHVAKASWIKGLLMCAEVRELRGGRIVTLESQVRKSPGRIDVYRSGVGRPDYDREEADRRMLQFAGTQYGYMACVRTFLIHAFVSRLFSVPNLNDLSVSKRPPYCSAACSIADHWGGGFDPVPNLSDADTEPSDLVRSPFYKYQFTLWP